MNTKAIVVYLDNTVRCLEEFSWLYKTWKMWDLDKEYDLVVYHNPSCSDKIPNEPKLVAKPMEPIHKKDPFWSDYPFVNSFAMFNNPDELAWIIERYTHIMKTDCDVFLTENIAGYAPQKLLVGQGGYYAADPIKNQDITDNLNRIRKTLKLNNNYLSHIGASIFGDTKSVTVTVNHQYMVTKYLLQTEWKENEGDWPGWFKGVASMYAIDLVINHCFNHQHVALYTLDEKCWEKVKITKNILHIHAWHSKQYFSKHDWFKGSYQPLKRDTVPDYAAEYCHWVVSNDLETLKAVIKTRKSL